MNRKIINEENLKEFIVKVLCLHMNSFVHVIRYFFYYILIYAPIGSKIINLHGISYSLTSI